jgi:hypothetical protein
MNIITPNVFPKLRITLPSELSSKVSNAPMMCSKRPFNEYTLFLILEQERNLKLREVYHKRGINLVHDDDSLARNQDTGLPSYPPRYHNLCFSANWFISKLNSRQPLPTKASAESWRSLDRMSKMFLQDVAAVLRDEYNANYQSECHTPVSTPILNRSMTITPVPSPAKRAANGLEALLMASEMAFPRLPSLDCTEDDSRNPLANKERGMSGRC